jgi:hypothetical protein
MQSVNRKIGEEPAEVSPLVFLILGHLWLGSVEASLFDFTCLSSPLSVFVLPALVNARFWKSRTSFVRNQERIVVAKSGTSMRLSSV